MKNFLNNEYSKKNLYEDIKREWEGKKKRRTSSLATGRDHKNILIK